MLTIDSILLVEDNPGDARLVHEHLREQDFTCDLRTAPTLAHAHQMLQALVPDIILLDLGLPDSSGLDAYASLSQAAPRTPIVILTGDDDDALALEALRIGAEDFLSKHDADGSRLLRAMRHALRRRMNAEALADRTARLHTIVQASEEGIALLDRRGVIHFLNARAADLLGLEDASGQRLCEQRSTPLQRWIAPEHEADIGDLLGTAVGGRVSRDLPLVRSDGSTVWVQAVVSGFEPMPDEPPELLWLLSDITARKAAEESLARVTSQLESRMAEREALLDNIQSSLQRLAQAALQPPRPDSDNPNGPGSNAAQTLRQDRSTAEPVSTQDLTPSLSGLLSMAASQRRPLQRQGLDLSALAEAIAGGLRRTAPGRQVHVSVSPDMRDTGDRDMVTGLLRRLLDNAWKFTEGNPDASISLSAVHSERGPAVYRLQDNGIGFDMAGAATLFEPFQRMASSQGQPGIGLGLSLARQAVERHGGRIWAESRPGCGTTVYFTLQPSVRQTAVTGP